MKFSLYVLRFRESAHFFDRNAEHLDHVLCWSKILFSLRNTRTPSLSSCLPTPLSLVPPSLISFPALSHLFFISSSSHFLSLSLSLPLVATLPSLFVTVSSTCSCSPAFAQALNAIYDHRYVLSRHIRSSWSLAFSPFVVLIAPLFGLLDGSLVLRTDLHVCFFRRAFDSFSSLTP